MKSKRFTFEVPKELNDMFEKMDKRAYAIAAQGLYAGAGLLADAIRAETPEDTGDLRSSLYISNFETDMSGVKTVVGFSGYDAKGTPNPIKAAVLESGDSRGKPATHFFSRAVRKAKTKAEMLIETEIDRQIYQIQKGD